MADFAAIDTAMQARAATVVVATTGSMTLTATATTYTRSTGSFLTDGFAEGMEVTPSGFATNAVNVIQKAEALTLTMLNAQTAEVAASGRTLSVGLPALRATDDPDFTPIANRPFVKMQLVTGPSFLRAGPAQNGVVEDTGFFIVQWFAISRAGATALRKAAQAVRDLFTPGTNITVGSDTVRVRTDVGTTLSQLQSNKGYTLCSINIPYRVHSTNVVSP